MKTEHHNKYMPGWQLLGHTVPEFENNQENEREEDEEYKFYNLAGTNPREMTMERSEYNT